MRIELVDSGEYLALRDYFLRLGASVACGDASAIDVEFPAGLLDEDESPEMYLETWVRVKRVDVRVASNGSSAAPEATGGPEPSIEAPDPDAPPRPRLGELLVRKGFITDEQLSQALVESRRSGDVVGRVLVRHGWVFDSELARVLAEQWSIPYVNLASVGVDRSALILMPPEIGRRYAAVPVRFVGGALRIAFADPSDEEAVAAVQSQMAFPIQPAVAELSEIDTIWRSAGV